MLPDISYESIYKGNEPYFPSDPLPQLLRALHDLQVPSRCLDVGCGEGRDSIMMASKGHHVTAIDSSDHGASRLQENARTSKLDIRVLASDVRAVELESESFDLIHARTVLDHLSWEDSMRIARKFVEALKFEGRLVVEVFAVNDPGNQSGLPASELATLVQKYFQGRELLELFEGLHLVSLDRCFKFDGTHGAPHFHETLILRADKKRTEWLLRPPPGLDRC